MAIALDCPHCGKAKVETVRHAWFIQGFLLFARYGSKPYIGCAACTRSKVVGSFVLSSLIGWWCFPWGLGTPLVMVQNLAEIAKGPDPRSLRALLAKQGIDMDDLELDESGRSRSDTKLVEGVLATMHRMVWADGKADAREIDAATEVAGRMLGPLADQATIRSKMGSQASPGELDPRGIGPDAQLMLLKAACIVAQADDGAGDAERAAIRDLGRRLGVASDLVERFVAGLDQRTDPALKAIAADVLGVDVDADPSAVRHAWQQLALAAGELDDADARSARHQELQFAYETLLGAAAPAEA